MCGIIGIVAKNKSGLFKHQADLFTNMLRMDSIRGEDSTGVFGVTKDGKLDYLKGDADGYTFTKCEDYSRFETQIFKEYVIAIGHNRKATKGVISAQNAHPFVQKNICLVHNGTIYNSQALNTEVEVDSEAIAHALAEHDAPAALAKLSGPFAIVWYDSKAKTLSLARNEQRPLNLISYQNSWVISSEIGLPFWLQARENHKSEGHKLVPTNKILVFNLFDLDKEPTEISYEDYKQYTPPVYNHSAWPGYSSPRVRQLSFPHSSDRVTQSQEIYKTGDVIKFKATSYNDSIPLDDRCLIGHPIFEGDLDANITVQIILPKGETVVEYLTQGDIFTAIIMNIRYMNGTQVIFAKSPVICKVVRDVHMEENNMMEVLEALKTGCNRCFKDMRFQDVDKSVVQKKKDGTWRKLCPQCVELSIQQAKAEKSLILPAANNVQ